MEDKKEYHILSLSGGKDSTALAFFMRDNMPEIFEKLELVFCDTEQEIPETYDYLNKIEVFLGKEIIRIKPKRSFDHIYQIYNQIPAINCRWCTVELKTKPFRNFIKNKYSNGNVKMYIGIRADEAFRLKTVKNTDMLKECHPFVDFNIYKSDVTTILKNVGIDYPDYYKWRERSGCYFCPFQSKKSWLDLYENHPNLYKKAMSYEFERGDGMKKNAFYWNADISLKDLIKPENIKLVKEKYNKIIPKDNTLLIKSKLIEIF